MRTRLGILTLLAVVAVLLAPSPAPAAAPADHGCHRTLASYPVLHPGARRPAVRTLQCALNDVGVGPVVVDGWYGPQTRRAVHRIEAGFEGEPPHPGRITHGFWTLLYGRQLPSHVLHRGDRGHAVRVLQRALRAAGGDLAVDGWFGPQTRSVLRSYQRHVGSRPTGRYDRQTAFDLSQGATF